MTRLAFAAIAACCCAVGGACAPSLDIPPPPDIAPALEAYENPTANVRSEVMGEQADMIAGVRQSVEDSNIQHEVLDLISEVTAKLSEATGGGGEIQVDELDAIDPDGVVTITRCCLGWESDEPEGCEDENGTIVLTLPLVGGKVGPMAYGEVDNCRFRSTVGGERFRNVVDGEIAVHFGLIDSSQPLGDLVLTFLMSARGRIENADFAIDQSFRLAADRFEVLVRLPDQDTFVYFFEGDRLTQGISDVTGTFGCSLEDRQCAKLPESFSW